MQPISSPPSPVNFGSDHNNNIAVITPLLIRAKTPDSVAIELLELSKNSSPPEINLVDQLCTFIFDNIDQFSPNALSVAISALAKMELLPDPLFKIASPKFIKNIDKISSLGNSSMLWAYARYKHKDDNLLRASYAQVIRKIEDYQPEDIADVLYSMNRFGIENSELVNPLIQRTLKLMATIEWNALHDIAQGFSVCGVKYNNLSFRLVYRASHIFTKKGYPIADIKYYFLENCWSMRQDLPS